MSNFISDYDRIKTDNLKCLLLQIILNINFFISLFFSLVAKSSIIIHPNSPLSKSSHSYIIFSNTSLVNSWYILPDLIFENTDLSP